MADTTIANDPRYQYTPKTLTTTSMITGKDASQLDMNDFFNLLVAQMTNQDMMNPQSDTEFVAQMAQFTSLQGIQTIQEYQLSSYAVSYVGKEVVIAYTDETGIGLEQVQGVVTNVTFYDGQPMVVVNGKPYPLYSVMEVISEGGTKYEEKTEDKDATDKTDETNKTEEPDDDDLPDA